MTVTFIGHKSVVFFSIYQIVRKSWQLAYFVIQLLKKLKDGPDCGAG